jgi:predicted nucleic acid-binding protein
MAADVEPTGPEQPARVERHRDPDEVVIRLPTLERLLRGWLPEETIQHLRAARREQLLAVRSLLDARIERLERAQARAEERRQATPRTDIPVE